jgi:hypothetical protein
MCVSSGPTSQQISDAIKSGTVEAARVSEVQTPTGHKVKLPDIGTLVEAQRTMQDLAHAAAGGSLTEEIQVLRL